MGHMELNTDYVQLALHMRCRFDSRDEFDQINGSKNYERLDSSPNHFRSDIIGLDFIETKLDLSKLNLDLNPN